MRQMDYAHSVFDAWLAGGEIPYDWLIPLLHQYGDSREVFDRFVIRKAPMEDMIPAKCRKKLTELSADGPMQTCETLMEKHGISSMTILDEDYPACLRELSDPPGILFYTGDLSCLLRRKRVSMVGSRTASYLGLRAARTIARDLSKNGVVIVSGLACGIDAECHRGCLEGGSPTIAVLGCGLDQDYPQENEPLKKDILSRNGLLLSEYAPGIKPLGHHFPYRNRIISGLSEILILMEAKLRSGSMTTVTHALKQGKEVYAYPGDPVSPMSEANRTLLREGAGYFTTAKDILEDMNWLDNQPLVGQNIGCSAPEEPADSTEAAVYNALLKGNLGFDELLQTTKLIPSELLSTLTVMQIKNKIEALPGKRYALRQSSSC